MSRSTSSRSRRRERDLFAVASAQRDGVTGRPTNPCRAAPANESGPDPGFGRQRFPRPSVAQPPITPIGSSLPSRRRSLASARRVEASERCLPPFHTLAIVFGTECLDQRVGSRAHQVQPRCRSIVQTRRSRRSAGTCVELQTIPSGSCTSVTIAASARRPPDFSTRARMIKKTQTPCNGTSSKGRKGTL